MMKTKIRSLLLVTLVFCAFSTQAMNLRWLEHSPVKYFDEQDWKLLKEAAQTALSEKPDGEGVKWRNEAAGHYGSLTPISHLQVDGRDCRDLVIRNFAGEMNGGGTYRFCRMEDGNWKVLGGKMKK